ncbi:uncharacterized protein BDR25DRAFT_350784 [Lindgomyces ingoldianus]|uniref:Uncharacterized protein n=1 Tax=Lindgomyces ingoldianus TaxID=673940 RepID=A0ACB6R811_9PLEO|nr:uncharacterized protein BDR25DRAFT_350784 [Lindgomyces ingoldianus]KAF2475408.1 hypothetical protein BDR25DRAFT_350784 [Lindgomyces ingoldianus]
MDSLLASTWCQQMRTRRRGLHGVNIAQGCWVTSVDCFLLFSIVRRKGVDIPRDYQPGARISLFGQE